MSTNDPNRLRTVRLRPYRKGHGPTFTLVTWDTNTTDSMGKARLRYELRMHIPVNSSTRTRMIVLFKGEDFCCSPMHAINSDAAVAGLLGFLTLRPGDTDAEYFERYTTEQLAYCQEHAEALGAEVYSRWGEL